MQAYKIMKVFDCWSEPGMPDNVRSAFFDLHKDPPIGNDVYVEWTVEWDDTGYNSDNEFATKRRLVDQWLIENGAHGRDLSQDKYNGETVIIKHWW